MSQAADYPLVPAAILEPDDGGPAAIVHLLGSISEAFETQDAGAISAFYADDAAFFAPGRPPVYGQAAIAQVMTEDMASPGFRLDLSPERIGAASSGDIAFARGTFEASFTNPATGRGESVRGHYLQLFRKQPDGSWRIAEDISSPGPA